MNPLPRLRLPWSTSHFGDVQLEAFAAPVILQETRTGLMAMALVSMILQAASALLHAVHDSAAQHQQTYALLVVLSLNVFFAARFVRRLTELHLLGVVLLMMTGMAYVLLAASSGAMSTVLVASVVLLFLGVPLVPWGLREALAVLGLVYVLFSSAMLGNSNRFDLSSVWTLQLLMLTAVVVACVLVSRNASVRRRELTLRYELERSRQALKDDAQRDVLTGAFNRRYLEAHFETLARHLLATHGRFAFAFVDLDDFKRLNDTHGHAHGDEVLRALTRSLRTLEEATVARFGGDEFGVIFHAANPAAAMQAAVQRLGDGAETAPCTASIGLLIVTPGARVDLGQCYAAADALLYEAKAEKRCGRSSLVEALATEEAAA